MLDTRAPGHLWDPARFSEADLPHSPANGDRPEFSELQLQVAGTTEIPLVDKATYRHLIVLIMVYALAALMVSNVRYFSFKEIDIHRRQPFWVLLLVIVALKLFIAEPQVCLFATFIGYAASGPIRWVWLYGRRIARRAVADRGLTSHRRSSSVGPQ